MHCKQKATYLNKSEQDHNFIEYNFDLLITDAFETFLQLLVDK